MGWSPVGHVLRVSNAQFWRETASNHLADFAISVSTLALARGRVRRASLTFLLVAGRDLRASRSTRHAQVDGDTRSGGARWVSKVFALVGLPCDVPARAWARVRVGTLG